MQTISDHHILELRRKVVERRAIYHCEYPGCGNFGYDLHDHHIFGRANKAVRYNPDNACLLCDGHHREAEKMGSEKFMAFLVYMGARPAEWAEELTHQKNQIVKCNDIYRLYWKDRLENELRGMAA